VLSTAVAVLAPLAIQAQTAAALTVVPSRDKKVVRRWALPGDPRGVAIGSDGTIYVGLAGPQAVIAVDPLTGAIKKRLVLDSAEIASTKELVTLRTNAERTRLYIANGSDESASILSIPNLGVLREITMVGESIRDVIPDPRGRYVYVLGRHVHVFDKDGQTVVRTLAVEEPMAIAVSSTGSLLSVLASQDFGNAKATVVALFDTSTLAEVEREPLQTEQSIEAVMFAAHDHSLVAFSRDSLYEKPLTTRPVRITDPGKGGSSQMRVEIGDLVNSDHVCLPEGSGPQVATLTATDTALVYAERRCSVSGTFSGSARGVTPASLYGISAYAVAYDKSSHTLAVTDRAGFLTIYSVPKPTVVR
jgi:DNA-binding beta-propeller fold protein YncE